MGMGMGMGNSKNKASNRDLPIFPPHLIFEIFLSFFWREKIVTSNRCEFDLYPTRGVTMGMGGEWELWERNDSRKLSRSYPRELWGRTPDTAGFVFLYSYLKGLFWKNQV